MSNSALTLLPASITDSICMYVPTLAEAIIKAEQAGKWVGGKLAGIAVGNGCSGSEVGVCAQEENFSYFRWAYLVQTAFISSSDKASIASTCNWTAASPLPSATCKAVLAQAAQSISNVNVYNVYGDCISGTLKPRILFSTHTYTPHHRFCPCRRPLHTTHRWLPRP